MFPSVPVEPTPTLTFWCVCLYLFVVTCSKYAFVNPLYPTSSRPRAGAPFLVVGVVLFAVTPFCTGDFFHMIDFVEGTTVEFDLSETSHYEVPYQWIAIFCGGNYWIFRLVVWGGAILLFALTAKRVGIDYRLALFIIFVISSLNFSYARSTLAQAIYFFGLSFFIRPTGKYSQIVGYAIGLLIILQAPFFHRSMWALVAITPLFFAPSFIAGRGTYWRTAVISIGIIIGTILLTGFLYVVDFSFLDEKVAGTSKHLTNYLDGGEGNSFWQALFVSPSAFLIKTVGLISNVGILALVTTAFSRCNDGRDLKVEQGIYKFYFAITFASLIMGMFVSGMWVLSYRLAIMAQIPCALLIGLMWTRGMLGFRTFRKILLLGGFSNFLIIAYTFYCTLV